MNLLRAAAALLCLVPGPLPRQDPGRPLAIEDWYRIRNLGAPALSPDGKWVAFTLSVHLEATNTDSSEVWLVAADGATAARRVSPAGMPAGAPEWQEDGKLEFQAAGKVWSLSPALPDSLVAVRIAAPFSGRNRATLMSADRRWLPPPSLGSSSAPVD